MTPPVGGGAPRARWPRAGDRGLRRAGVASPRWVRADQRAVRAPPDRRVAGPAGQVFAVEEGRRRWAQVVKADIANAQIGAASLTYSPEQLAGWRNVKLAIT